MIRAISLACGLVGGVVATVLAMGHGSGRPIEESVRLDPMSMIGGGVAGALVGHLPWACTWLRRGSRVGPTLVVANCAAWLLFMAAHPRVDSGDGDPVVRHRAVLDAEAAAGWPGGTFVSHPPSLLAGRPLTWVWLSEKPLGLLAGPAVAFVEKLVVRERYIQTGPTISESYVVAAVAFVLSTAWWATAALVWTWLRHRRRSVWL